MNQTENLCYISSEAVEKLAQMIHSEYNRKKLLKSPEIPIEYPDWNTLPQTLKKSNARQAMGYLKKLELLDMYATDEIKDNEVTSLPKDMIELLAKEEHEEWCSERIGDGWVYGDIKDVERKISPDLIPFEMLSEEKKQYDMDAVNNLIPMLNNIGLKIYRKSAVHTEEENEA